MNIIGIAGKKRVGKDTVCEIIRLLMEDSGRPVIRIGFADALKQEVSNATGHTVDYIEQHKDNFRLILQGWGTDYRRHLHGNNYWINKCKDSIRFAIERHPSALIIVPDVRFLNEAEAIKKLGGLLWQVKRQQKGDCDIHSSETELDNYDGWNSILDNNGSLNDLYTLVKDRLQYYSKLI